MRTMTLPFSTLAVSVLALSSPLLGCKADAPAPAPAAKPAGPEIGRACTTRKDCSGNPLATICGKDGDLSGFEFCTSDCAVNFTAKAQCGDGGACVYVGEGKGRCVPQDRAKALAKPLPPAQDVANPCCLPKEVNATGVGKQCKVALDCSGYGTAKSCPQAIRAGLPNWCTHLCDFGDDASCGPDAFCWWRKSEDRGMVGSCAPNACKKSNNPPACPEGTAVAPAAAVAPAPQVEPAPQADPAPVKPAKATAAPGGY